jgi:hypothetical protein
VEGFENVIKVQLESHIKEKATRSPEVGNESPNRSNLGSIDAPPLSDIFESVDKETNIAKSK